MAVKRVAARRAVIAIGLLLIASLNGAAGLLPELFGGRPLLIVSAALAAAACEDVSAAVIFGAVSGALADISSSGGIGFYAFALAVCGYALPTLMRSRFRSNPPSALLLILCFAAAVITARYLVSAFRSGLFDSAVLFALHGISKIFLTFICAVPLYFFDRMVTGGGR